MQTSCHHFLVVVVVVRQLHLHNPGDKHIFIQSNFLETSNLSPSRFGCIYLMAAVFGHYTNQVKSVSNNEAKDLEANEKDRASICH